MKFFTIFLVLLAVSFSVDCPAQDTIRIANGEWPPFQSKKLKHYGVASRVVTEAFELEGVKVEYQFLPWERGIQLAKQGKINGTMVWSKTPDREKDFMFTDPICFGITVFFHHQDFQFEWQTIDDLKDLRIGGTIGFNYGSVFEEAEKQGKIKVSRVPADKINFRKLLKNRIDIFPLDIETGHDILKKEFPPQEISKFTYNKEKPLRTIAYGLMLSKGLKSNENYLKLFNKGLKKLKESGKYDQYFAESARGEYLPK